MKDLKNKVVDALENKDRYKNFGIQARKIASANFDIDKIAREYEKTYDEIIKTV